MLAEDRGQVGRRRAARWRRRGDPCGDLAGEGGGEPLAYVRGQGGPAREQLAACAAAASGSVIRSRDAAQPSSPAGTCRGGGTAAARATRSITTMVPAKWSPSRLPWAESRQATRRRHPR